MSIAIGPENGLSGAQADEPGTDRCKDGYTSFGDVGVFGIDELVAMLLTTRRVRELDHAVHRDNVARNPLSFVDGGASQFLQQQLADLGQAAGGAGGDLLRHLGPVRAGGALDLPRQDGLGMGIARPVGGRCRGDGGDELFGGNVRYAKQYVFSLYERIINLC